MISRSVALVRQVLDRMRQDNVPLLAAAVAFWGLLAMVPGLVATVSIYGLVAEPDEVERQVRESTAALPEEAQALIIRQLQSVVESSAAGLGVGLVIGVVTALFVASAGMRTLTTAVAIVYGDAPEDRGFLAERGQAIALTLGLVALVATAVFVAATLPAHWLVSLLRWPALGTALVFGIGVMYRLGPASRPAKRLLTPGAVTAAVVGVLVTLGFSFYAGTVADYDETYGTLGAVVVLLLWLQLTAMSVLIGAEVNMVRRQR